MHKNFRWTNAEVVSSWLSAEKDIEIMCERDSRVRSILDRGYNRSRLVSKFNTLVSLAENKKLKPDAGNLPSFLVLKTCCSCLTICMFLFYRVQNKVPSPPEESFDTYCVFCSCLYVKHPFISQTSAWGITIKTEGIITCSHAFTMKTCQ